MLGRILQDTLLLRRLSREGAQDKGGFKWISASQSPQVVQWLLNFLPESHEVGTLPFGGKESDS